MSIRKTLEGLRNRAEIVQSVPPSAFHTRNRRLVVGNHYRKFYAGVSEEFYCDSPLRLGLYGAEPRPLDIVGREFHNDPRERKLMIRLLERWYGKNFNGRELRVFADDFRLVG